MGHINFDNLVKVRKKEGIKEILEISKPKTLYGRTLYKEKNQEKVYVKGVFDNKTIGDCTY
jgi:phage-related protein